MWGEGLLFHVHDIIEWVSIIISYLASLKRHKYAHTDTAAHSPSNMQWCLQIQVIRRIIFFGRYEPSSRWFIFILLGVQSRVVHVLNVGHIWLQEMERRKLPGNCKVKLGRFMECILRKVFLLLCTEGASWQSAAKLATFLTGYSECLKKNKNVNSSRGVQMLSHSQNQMMSGCLQRTVIAIIDKPVDN